MHHPGLFIRIAAIASSLALATGFILYQTGRFDGIIPSASPFPDDVHAAAWSRIYMAVEPDTNLIRQRLPLLDSSQRTFLGLLAGQFPPPKGTSHFDSSYVDSILAMTRQHNRRTAGSTKSGVALRIAYISVAKIDSIRTILLGDTTRTDPHTLAKAGDTAFLSSFSLRLEHLIYPQWAGLEDRWERATDSFPMSPLGIVGVPGGIDTLRTTDSNVGPARRD